MTKLVHAFDTCKESPTNPTEEVIDGVRDHDKRDCYRVQRIIDVKVVRFIIEVSLLAQEPRDARFLQMHPSAAHGKPACRQRFAG